MPDNEGKQLTAEHRPLSPTDGMRPVLIVPPDTMSAEDIQLLRENGICTVVCKDPAAVKFLDPIPAMTGRTKIEEAAIELSRKLLNWKWYGNSDLKVENRLSQQDIATLYVHLLTQGTRLSTDPTPEEIRRRREKEIEQEQHYAKLNEARRIGQEEARAERAAAKKAAAEAEAAKGKKDGGKAGGK